MKSFSLSELNRHPGIIVDAALKERVSLTKHGKRNLVMMYAETYERLAETRAHTLRNASNEVHEEVIEALDSIL